MHSYLTVIVGSNNFSNVSLEPLAVMLASSLFHSLNSAQAC